MQTTVDNIISESGVGFGTSGVRGLIQNMTDKVCFAYVTAFLEYMKQEGYGVTDKRIGIAGDLRNSTDRIMNACAAACVSAGFEPVNLGKIPSPAIALYGLNQSIPTIMVTGSHIPEDRNGIKFNTPFGEILKKDEIEIKSIAIEIDDNLFVEESLKQNFLPDVIGEAREAYLSRFINLFPDKPLQGLRIGVYQHSSVARELLVELFECLGSTVISLGRSDVFVSVDTEAIRPEDIELADRWSAEFDLDCIVSTDGDADRPLVSDENGKWLRGDVIGILTANFLNADIIATPVNSNTALEKCGKFAIVKRTRIGSPYVIEAMIESAKTTDGCVVGYEANGGFMQQTSTQLNGNTLTALPTRDAVIVMLAVLIQSQLAGQSISELMTTLPPRYTVSNRIKDLPTETSKSWLADMVSKLAQNNTQAFEALFPELDEVSSVDETDGLRLTLKNQNIVHFRPSGNAPELRCYTESDDADVATQLNQYCLEQLSAALV